MQDISVRKNNLKADVEPIVLSQKTTTRLVLKPEKYPDSGLRLHLVHQKGSKLWEMDVWEDEEKFKKRQLKQGEFVSFELGTNETKKLLEALPALAALADIDFEPGNSSLTVLRGRERETIQQLMNETGSNFCEFIEELNPGLISHVAVLKEYKKRQAILAEFKEALEEKNWAERQWQQFFSDNSWIFGQGLDYRMLSLVTDQPNYGGASVLGEGAQKGDYLLATQANARFTVLVEIKRPDTQLVKDKEYRNGAYPITDELAGGVSQLQVNCKTWNRSSEIPENIDELEAQEIYTCEPKGILIVGNLEQVEGLRNKRNSFELFRRNLNNPEIITFDELYARAEFIVSNMYSQTPTEVSSLQEKNVPVEVPF